MFESDRRDCIRLRTVRVLELHYNPRMARTAVRAASEAAGSEAENSGMMGILEHLEELRTRLIRACVAIGAGIVCFVAAALLTSSSDPGNQALMAAPMIGLYVISIGVAWLVRPRDGTSVPPPTGLRLVVSATMLDQALRARRVPSAPSRRRFSVLR